MKITVELDDFWIEEGELNDCIISAVKKDVVAQITKSIEDRVQVAITTRVEATIKDKIAPIIDTKLTELVTTGTIVVNKAEIKIEDHVKSIFQSNTGWSNPRDQLVRLANTFGAQLKAQYDAVFANRIVIAIKEQGMLKDEVVQMLLEKK